jgi:outer membrane receptor for ferrienterochelin and colicin
MKKIFWHTLVVLLIIISNQATIAQHMVSGVVLEEKEKGKLTPLPYAKVYWANSDIGVITDSLGTFKIEHTEKYSKLVVSFVGYTSDTLDIDHNKLNDLKIVLKKRKELQLEEVTVAEESKSIKIRRLDAIKANVMEEKELFKAACCNLSESFSTNPAVDVTYSDAITGAKQIQMLGLAGIYTQINAENIPTVRGLNAIHGLSHIPGSWVESIQVTKGIGTVVNGYESMTGQINAEMRKPEGKDRIFANVYANHQGRYEGNLVATQKINNTWSTALLLHSSTRTFKMDQNNDGFMDMPMGYQNNLINRWKFDTHKGWQGQFGVKVLIDNLYGGQMSHNGENQLTTLNNGTYGVNLYTERFEVFGKTGYVFPKKKHNSIALIANAFTHNQRTFFGANSYNAREQSVYTNLIFQSIIGTTIHKFKAGISFLHDVHQEQVVLQNPGLMANVGRVENVPGIFYEHTWTVNENWMVIGGIRGDYHNIFGAFITPRLHARYDLGDGTVLHITAGQGRRTANIFAENMQLFASSRQFVLPNQWQTRQVYNLQQEVAWNTGLSFTTDVKIGRRYATLELDVFRTQFQNQIVIDLDNSAQQVAIYNLTGQSFANSAQAQINYSPIRRLDLRIAYRYFDVRTDYQSGLLQRYLLSPHRAFVNASYKTKSKWAFDATVNWFAPKRLPTTANNPEQLRLGENSPAFFVINSQLTKTLGKKWDVYVGVENLLDFRQERLIVDPNNPFGNNFDASIVWGPIQGRMIYVGARFRIKK